MTRLDQALGLVIEATTWAALAATALLALASLARMAH